MTTTKTKQSVAAKYAGKEAQVYNVKTTVDAKKERASVGIDLKGHDLETVLKLRAEDKLTPDKYIRTGTNIEGKVTKTGEVKTTGNIRVASTLSHIPFKHPSYPHLVMSLQIYQDELYLEEEQERRDKEAERLAILADLEAQKAKEAADQATIKAKDAEKKANAGAKKQESAGDFEDIAFLIELVKEDKSLIKDLEPADRKRIMMALAGK